MDPSLVGIIVCVIALRFSCRDFVFVWEYTKSEVEDCRDDRVEAGSVDETIDGAGDHECHC
jgi:hypothetical protein